MVKILGAMQYSNFIKLVKKICNENEENEIFTNLLKRINDFLQYDIIISVNDKNSINGFAIVFTDNYFSNLLSGFKEFYIYYYDNTIIQEEILKYITSNYKDIILLSDSREDIYSKYLNHQDMYMGDEYIDFSSFEIYIDKPCDYILNKFLDKYYSKLEGFSFDKIVFKYITKNDLFNMYYDSDRSEYKLPIINKRGTFGTFLGFRYFSPMDIRDNYFLCDFEDNSKFLCALYNDVIIGAIKTCYVNDKFPYLCVSYIDVHKDFKSKGLGRILVQQLNKLLDNTLVLVGTPLSDEGKKCHMDEVFRKYVTNTVWYKSSEEYYLSLNRKRILRE